MGILAKLFSKRHAPLAQVSKQSGNILDVFAPYFSNDVGPKFNATFMSAVNAHAKNFEKIQPRVYLGEERTKNKKYIDRLLNLQPNPEMTAPMMWKMVATTYFRDNISILYLDWDWKNIQEPLKAIYPLDFEKNSIQTVENNGKLYLKFVINTNTYQMAAEDLIILVREADPANLFGTRSPAINQVLKVIQTNYEGVEQTIKQSAFLRYIVTTAGVMSDQMKEEKMKQYGKMFEKATQEGGILFTDAANSITPITSNAQFAHSDDMQFFKNDILNYQGITENIMRGDFTEDQYQAYYETSLEPLIVELETELTRKIFSLDEIRKGNNIKITACRLTTASISTRIKIAELLLKNAKYVPNQVNDLLYLDHVEGGDEVVSNLTYKNDKDDKDDEKEEKDDEKGDDVDDKS